MAQGEETDSTPTAPEPEEDDDTDSDPGEDTGTPAQHKDEDLQSPELDVDELPAY